MFWKSASDDFLITPCFVTKRQISLFAEIADRHDGDELSLTRKLYKIHDRFAASRWSSFGNLVHLDLEDLTVVGEDHQVRVSRCDEKMLDEIFVLRGRTETAFAATTLTRVRRNRRALDVSGFRYGNRDVFVLDEIFDIELGVEIDDDSPSSVAEILLDFF
jgi:hypothetical protein